MSLDTNTNDNNITETETTSNSLGILSVRNTNKPVMEGNQVKKEYNPKTKQHDKIVFSDEYSNNIAITVLSTSKLKDIPTLSVQAVKMFFGMNPKLQHIADKPYHQSSVSDEGTKKHNGTEVKCYSVVFRPEPNTIDYSNITLADLS